MPSFESFEHARYGLTLWKASFTLLATIHAYTLWCDPPLHEPPPLQLSTCWMLSSSVAPGSFRAMMQRSESAWMAAKAQQLPQY